jgi:hypothetical protein
MSEGDGRVVFVIEVASGIGRSLKRTKLEAPSLTQTSLEE